jgi:hypothetical protein
MKIRMEASRKMGKGSRKRDDENIKRQQFGNKLFYVQRAQERRREKTFRMYVEAYEQEDYAL